MPNWEKSLIAFGINIVLLIIIFKVLDIIDGKIRNKIATEESN